MNNRKPALQSGAMEFKRCGHLFGKEGLTKACYWLHYGKGGIQCLWSVTYKGQDIVAFAASVLTTLFSICLSQVLQLCGSAIAGVPLYCQYLPMLMPSITSVSRIKPLLPWSALIKCVKVQPLNIFIWFISQWQPLSLWDTVRYYKMI